MPLCRNTPNISHEEFTRFCSALSHTTKETNWYRTWKSLYLIWLITPWLFIYYPFVYGVDVTSGCSGCLPNPPQQRPADVELPLFLFQQNPTSGILTHWNGNKMTGDILTYIFVKPFICIFAWSRPGDKPLPNLVVIFITNAYMRHRPHWGTTLRIMTTFSKYLNGVTYWSTPQTKNVVYLNTYLNTNNIWWV